MELTSKDHHKFLVWKDSVVITEQPRLWRCITSVPGLLSVSPLVKNDISNSICAKSHCQCPQEEIFQPNITFWDRHFQLKSLLNDVAYILTRKRGLGLQCGTLQEMFCSQAFLCPQELCKQKVNFFISNPSTTINICLIRVQSNFISTLLSFQYGHILP